MTGIYIKDIAHIFIFIAVKNNCLDLFLLNTATPRYPNIDINNKGIGIIIK